MEFPKIAYTVMLNDEKDQARFDSGSLEYEQKDGHDSVLLTV